MNNRQFNANAYNYGMNTQEKDNEIFEGAYTAQYWEYDSRTGRRWNLDPVDQVSISNYATFANNPVMITDVKGDVAGGGGNAPPISEDSPLKTPKFSLFIGNVNSTLSQRQQGPNHTTGAFALNNGTQTYFNTKMTPNNIFGTITEPNFNVQFLSRLDFKSGPTNFQLGLNIQKLKTDPYDSPAGRLKNEAFSNVGFMAARNFDIGGIGKHINFSMNIGVATGPTFGHLQREPNSKDLIKGYEGWHYGGWGNSFLLRLDASINNKWTIYQNLNLHNLKTAQFNVDGIIVPSQSQSSLSFQWGLGYKFNRVGLRHAND